LYSVQSYVREQILQAIAVIVKRGTLESSTNDRGIVFNEIAKHITSGTLSEVGVSSLWDVS